MSCYSKTKITRQRWKAWQEALFELKGQELAITLSVTIK